MESTHQISLDNIHEIEVVEAPQQATMPQEEIMKDLYSPSVVIPVVPVSGTSSDDANDKKEYSPPIDEFNVREEENDDFVMFENDPALEATVDKQL